MPIASLIVDILAYFLQNLHQLTVFCPLFLYKLVFDLGLLLKDFVFEIEIAFAELVVLLANFLLNCGQFAFPVLIGSLVLINRLHDKEELLVHINFYHVSQTKPVTQQVSLAANNDLIALICHTLHSVGDNGNQGV